jgi:hypothetical protein
MTAATHITVLIIDCARLRAETRDFAQQTAASTRDVRNSTHIFPTILTRCQTMVVAIETDSQSLHHVRKVASMTLETPVWRKDAA